MPEQTYTPGQCWISDTEPELGLGIISATAGRTVTLEFFATGESRTYARDNTPLTRVLFQAGDIIESNRGVKITVQSLVTSDGLVSYTGIRDDGAVEQIKEQSLSPFMQFNRPQVRLFTGQIDENSWFKLRRETLAQQQRIEQSDLIGLGGARTELLPHQLYIAHETAGQPYPRVLLADEVGLGKTIEACLILHAQLLTGRARRALIVVPDPLLHQWLVELLRRFNLSFSLYDEPRCQAIEESEQESNPFLAEQLVLCGLKLLTDSEERLTQALAGEWDILIVDEAHHLEWHEESPSNAYQAIDALSRTIPGVLLLTATPEQLGREGHFARLRLLDPDRFPSLRRFQQEQSHYQPIADAAACLSAAQPISAETSQLLAASLGESKATPLLEIVEDTHSPAEERHQAREQLIHLLLDRHGTGRGMFRNTRERVKGFPPRLFHPYPLTLPALYHTHLNPATTPVSHQLQPERWVPHIPGNEWWRNDPRVDWLIELLRDHRQEKLLLICAQASTAIDLELALRIREGITAALFHEGMSIIERDRAAAWFADREQGCQILLCSEIGSEGRNFQFAHHLILFDLPENPDLLEQRIGRLDRIGQTATIELHAPYFSGSAQEVLLRWYDEGLNAFAHTCQTGQQIRELLAADLTRAFEMHREEPDTLSRLLDATRKLHADISEQLKNGRDHLLELNSCRDQEARQLVDRLRRQDQDSNLPDYMDRLLAAFGVESEPHSQHSLVIRPGQHMLTEHFPYLPEDGITATYDRATALSHEDRRFLTWEHPMVRAAMGLILESSRGNCTAAGLRHPELPSGSLAVELLFVLECPAPRMLQASRFLPPTLLPILLDQRLKEIGREIASEHSGATIHPLPKAVVRKIVTPLRTHIEKLVTRGEQLAAIRTPMIIEQARAAMCQHYTGEIDRLEALRKVNPNIKPSDRDLLAEHQEELNRHLDASRVRLDSLRLLIGT